MKTITCKNLVFGEGRPKIAVPVSPASVEEAREQCEQAVKAGADLIEFRADTCPGYPDCGEILARLQAIADLKYDMPVLFTIRTTIEGGSGEHSPEAYAGMIERAAQSGLIDLADVEFEREDARTLVEVLHQAGIPVILSYHDFHSVPSEDEIIERLMKMEEMGGDIAKIACMPAKRGDAETILAASAKAKKTLSIPFLTIAMGSAGLDSRLSAEVYGSAFTFGCLPGKMSAPGQMDVSSLRKELDALHELREQTGGFVFLVGFMGTGKSSTAQSLSHLTGRPVIEMDERIEAEQGKTIRQIFAEEGEAAFRHMETEMLAGFYKEEGAIVSCGGGLAVRKENVDLMKALGTVYLLTAEPESILERLSGKADNRPLLKDRMTVEGIKELMDSRLPYYEAAADIRVRTDGKRTREISREISEMMSKGE